MTAPTSEQVIHDLCEDILDALNFEPDDFSGPHDEIAAVLRPALAAVTAELDQARQMLADAPHDQECGFTVGATRKYDRSCTCWKAGL